MKRVAVGISVAVGVLVLLGGMGLIVFYSVAGLDSPPPDTSDLVPARPFVEAESNAYTYFIAATNDFYWPTNATGVTDYLDGKSSDDRLAREVIAMNTGPVALIERGLACDICQGPEVTGFDTLLPYVQPWRDMARVLAVKIMCERQAGHIPEATDTCIVLLRFGDRIQRDADCIVNYLVGIAILNIGLEQAAHLSSSEQASEAELAALSRALREVGPLDWGLVRAFKVEYKVAANLIDDIHSGKLTEKRRKIHGYVFQPNKTKQIVADHYRTMMRNAPLYYADMKLFNVEAKTGLNESKMSLFIHPNAIGKKLLGLLLPTLDSILEKKCRTESALAATRLILACKAFELDNDALPDSLAALVPDYLDAVPSDPYDGRPFRYSPTKRLVYSVGKDLQDSGGSTELREKGSSSSNRWDARDAVFFIRDGTGQPSL